MCVKLNEERCWLFEAVQFESWLRYYYLAEVDNGKDVFIFLAIPDFVLERIKAEAGHLLELALDLNQKPIDFETSRAAILKYWYGRLKKAGIGNDVVPGILQSSVFAEELELYQDWLGLQALEMPVMFFGEWQKLYERWRPAHGNDDDAPLRS